MTTIYQSAILCSFCWLACCGIFPVPAASQTHDPIAAKTQFSSHQVLITIERFDPKGQGPHQAVMLVHGAGGAQGGWRSSGMLEALTGAGYSVFVPHYFEAGSWDRAHREVLFPLYLQTLKDALLCIMRQPSIAKEKGIGLVGYSLGGYLVLGLAEQTSRDPLPGATMEIKAVVELYGAMPAFDARNLKTMAPVLILHGANDETVPVSNAYELDSLLTEKKVPHEVKIYSDQGHGFNGDALKDSNRRAVSFLDRSLQ